MPKFDHSIIKINYDKIKFLNLKSILTQVTHIEAYCDPGQ